MKATLNERVPPCLCPSCGQLLDAATDSNLAGKYPSPGDFSVCIKCASVLLFTDAFKLRPATSLEISTLPKKVAVDLNRAVLVARQLMQTLQPRGH